MNIYVYNCPNTFNYGSMMMGENFISYFNKITGGENIYYVETEDEININRLKEATNSNEIYGVKMDALFREGSSKYDYLLGYLKTKKVTSELLDKIDLVVVLGGDDFTEDYGWRGPVINAIKFNILRRYDVKVIMLGQTMGPYLSFRKYVMQHLLKKIDKIYPRDPKTYKYLKELGLENIKITDDLALLPLSKQTKKERTREYITYCPSELIYRYSKTGSREDWINYNLFMIETLMNRYPDKKLVLLAHVLKPENVDDRIVATELYELVKDQYRERIILLNNEMYPYEVREYIQQSLVTISSRMHPVISSIQCEIPSIALSYSTKYWGIIGERYSLEDFIIDVRYLNYKEMKDKFNEILIKIDSRSDEIIDKMKEKNNAAHQVIQQTLIEMKNL
ncbi:polysaccharide pyruvyl transferase family protein [Bacillus sp. PAMC26568]|nr:polysaccharide pyruvyl transferase family protein [Bacillus sp. PAMC26568]